MTTDQLNGAPISTCSPNPQVVQGIEYLLREAKKGNVTGFLLVGMHPEMGPFETTAGVTNGNVASSLLGAMQVLAVNVSTQLLAARASQQAPGLVRANQIPDVAGLFKR